MNKKKQAPLWAFKEWDKILCINDIKNNIDIPEIQEWKRYTVIEVSPHWRPRVIWINEEWEEELCFYNPNRFRKILSKEEHQEIIDESIKIIEENQRKKAEAIAKKFK